MKKILLIIIVLELLLYAFIHTPTGAKIFKLSLISNGEPIEIIYKGQLLAMVFNKSCTVSHNENYKKIEMKCSNSTTTWINGINTHINN